MTVDAWLAEHKFVTNDHGCHEVAWDHSSGCGFVTFRIIPIDTEGYMIVIVRSGQTINIGWATSFEQLQAVYAALSGLQG